MPKKMPDVAKAFAKHMGHLDVEGGNVKPGDKVKATVHGEVSHVSQHKGDKKPRASVDITKVEHHSPALKKEKAKEMLRHGTVKGKPLTKAQKGYFGAVAGGNAKKGK